MANHLILTDQAERDLAEAVEWYETRRPGLGKRLIDQMDRALEAIRRMPEAYPVVARGCRKSLVKKFPYTIFYGYQNSLVTVIAVFQNAQNPEKWKQRISSED